jgi:hypothetical protein
LISEESEEEIKVDQKQNKNESESKNFMQKKLQRNNSNQIPNLK